MIIQKLFVAFFVIIFSFNTSYCKNNNDFNEIEGLWISAEETTSLFGPWAEKVALLIGRDTNKSLYARGFFMKDGESIAEWIFVNIRYESMNSISLIDEDSDTLICNFDEKNKILYGKIHSHDEQKSLNFVHAGKFLENRLLYARTPDENGKIKYSYCKPDQNDDSLKTESIYNFSCDSASISKLMKEIINQKYGKIKSLLILKDGKLVTEEYFYGYNRDDLQQIRSCTKSVASILLGIALDRHKEINIDQPLFNFFPDYDSLKLGRKKEIKLKNILTMTSGLEWDDYPPEMFKTNDCFQYILSRPLDSRPGEKFNYNSGCSVLLGGVIESLELKNTLIFADEFLFKPMGIKDYLWESHNNNILRCGEGLSLRPRDMAKIGLLVLNNGKWLNKQIVSKEWISESTKPHVKESDYFDYGYQWWHHSKNNLHWWKQPDTTFYEGHDLITALGYAGQFIMIVKDLNLVVVITASDFGSGEVARSKIPMVIDKIIPIFEKAGIKREIL